jgi:hypothetical protein
MVPEDSSTRSYAIHFCYIFQTFIHMYLGNLSVLLLGKQQKRMAHELVQLFKSVLNCPLISTRLSFGELCQQVIYCIDRRFWFYTIKMMVLLTALEPEYVYY